MATPPSSAMITSFALFACFCLACTLTPCRGIRLGSAHSRGLGSLSNTSKGEPTVAVPEGKQELPGRSIPAMFAFGDANIDTGNNDFLNASVLHNNYPPLGRSFFGQPSGRATDGRLVIDFLAESLGIPLLPPSLDPKATFASGVSFGSGGATAASPGVGGQNIGLAQQVANFMVFRQKAGAGATPAPMPDAVFQGALYVLQCGEVDFLVSFIETLGVPAVSEAVARQLAPGVQDGVLKAILDAVTSLYDSGARKFLVLAPYPLGCLPLLRSRSLQPAGNSTCLGYVNDIMADFSAALGEELSGLRGSLQGATVLFSKADLVLRKVIQGPEPNGFAPSLDACCGVGDFNGAGPCGLGPYTVCPETQKRIYWDWIHNSEALFEVVAKEAWSGETFIEPTNVLSLIQ